MIYHVKYFTRRDRPVQRYGVPMFLVHMITGNNGCISVAKLDCMSGVAFKIDRQRMRVCADKSEHFFVDFEHECIFIKRKTFAHPAFLLETISTDRFQVYFHVDVVKFSPTRNPGLRKIVGTDRKLFYAGKRWGRSDTDHKCGANETPNATVVTYLSDETYWFKIFGIPYM